MSIEDKDIPEVLEACIKKSMNSLPIQVFLSSESQLNMAKNYLKNKHNAKKIILTIGKAVPSHVFPEDSAYVKSTDKQEEKVKSLSKAEDQSSKSKPAVVKRKT